MLEQQAVTHPAGCIDRRKSHRELDFDALKSAPGRRSTVRSTSTIAAVLGREVYASDWHEITQARLTSSPKLSVIVGSTIRSKAAVDRPGN
jgi:hypothetical protein